MYRLEERNGKLIFHSSSGASGKIFGIFLLAIAGLILYWGYGGSFAVAKLVEPVTFIRAAITFALSFFFLKLGAAVMFKSTTTEISLMGGSISRITKFLGYVKVIKYERGDCTELYFRDLISEYAEKYSEGQILETKMAKTYLLELETQKGKPGLKDYPILVLYADSDGEKVRQIGEKVAKALGLTLQQTENTRKISIESEIIFKNDGPIIGAIFEEKVEARDLYYNFYQVVSDAEQTLTLAKLAVAKLGETAPSDRFGWLFPKIDALEGLPRDADDPEGDFDESADHPLTNSEDRDDAEEDFDDDESGYSHEEQELSDPQAVNEIVVTRAGSVYRDNEGRTFRRWDGTRKPYREV